MIQAAHFRRTEGRWARRKARVNAYLSGDEITGKAVLPDVVNATVGFERPALGVLQKQVGVKLTVRAA